MCLHVELVSRSKDYVRSRMKSGSVVRLYTAVSPNVPEMEGIHATAGILFFFFLRMYLWWSLYTRTPGGVTEGDNFPLFVDSTQVL